MQQCYLNGFLAVSPFFVNKWCSQVFKATLMWTLDSSNYYGLFLNSYKGSSIYSKCFVINIHPNREGVVKFHFRIASSLITAFWSSFISGHEVSWPMIFLTATIQFWYALSLGLDKSVTLPGWKVLPRSNECLPGDNHSQMYIYRSYKTRSRGSEGSQSFARDRMSPPPKPFCVF